MYLKSCLDSVYKIVTKYQRKHSELEIKQISSESNPRSSKIHVTKSLQISAVS